MSTLGYGLLEYLTGKGKGVAYLLTGIANQGNLKQKVSSSIHGHSLAYWHRAFTVEEWKQQPNWEQMNKIMQNNKKPDIYKMTPTGASVGLRYCVTEKGMKVWCLEIASLMISFAFSREGTHLSSQGLKTRVKR